VAARPCCRYITPTTDRSPRLGTDEKVKLFASLFRGREDVYPVRWESKAGKSGYSPACANEWRAGNDCDACSLAMSKGQEPFRSLKWTPGVAAASTRPWALPPPSTTQARANTGK
jgi:hypothetical protein